MDILRIVDESKRGDVDSFRKFLTDHGITVDFRDSRDYTVLMVATERNLPSAVSTLIAAGADVNVTVSRDNHLTPIIIAAERGYTDCLTLLLQAGAEVAVCGDAQETALTLAVRGSHLPCVEALLQYRIDMKHKLTADSQTTSLALNSVTKCLNCVSEDGSDVKHELTADSQATNLISDSDTNCLKCLSGYGTGSVIISNRCLDFINVKNMEGKTALILASEVSSFKICQALISHGADLNVQDNEGKTALMHSVHKRNPDICKLLIDNMADVNIQDKDGKSALLYGIFSGFFECLLESKNISDNQLQTVLDYLLESIAKFNHDVPGLSCPRNQIIHDCFLCVLESGNISDNQLQTILVHLLVDIADFGEDGCNMRPFRNRIIHDSFLTFLECDKLSLNQLQTAVVYLVENNDNYDEDLLISSLLRLRINPILKSSQRSRKIASLVERKGAVGVTTLIFYPEITRLFICNGMIPGSYSTLFYWALEHGQYDMVRYFIATCYLTSGDVQLFYKNAVNLRPTRPKKTRGSSSSRRPIKQRKCITNENLFLKGISQPWPLVKLAFIAVSSSLGIGPKRELRVRKTGLPDRIQRMLMFQEPVALLPVKKWSKIPLCFDPVAYERLPKPRPLLYYWPIGRDIVMEETLSGNPDFYFITDELEEIGSANTF